nr:ATP-binding protein [Azospirillum rugosum]
MPLVLFAAGVTAFVLHTQQERMRDEAVGRADALSARIDHDLATQIELLKVLARSPRLDEDVADLAPFYEVATRFKAELPHWDRIFLANIAGDQLVNTGLPFGTPLGHVVDEAGHLRVVAVGKPIVGNMVGPGTASPNGRGMVSVRAPVIRHGQVVYTLAATIKADRFADLLRAGLREPLRGIVVDNAGVIVATTGNPDRIGQSPGPMALKARAEGDAGVYRGLTPDNAGMITAFRKSPETGWSVHVAIPIAVYQAPFDRSVWILAIACVAALGLTALLVGLLRRELRAERQDIQAKAHAARMEALGRMTGGVAHDVNNLLMAVQGNADLIGRRLRDRHHVEDAKLDRHLASIKLAVEKGTRITRDLLVFSRGGSAAHVETIDLAERIGGNLGLIRQSLTGAIALDLDLTPGFRVAIDPVQLDLALINLAVNARDAMPDGGTLRIALERTTLEGGEEGRAVTLSVTDSGVGVPPEILPHVFEPFFTTKGVGSGTGLGLSQVYGLAKAAGGGVSITSAEGPGEGQGTTVSIHLPLAEETEGTAVAGWADAPADRIGPGTRLLLVEDNEEVGRVTTALLTDAGFTVRRVVDAEAALDLLSARSPEDPIQVVVSDIRLPGSLDGVALARRVREDWPDLPVLLVSGYSDSIAEARALGFTVIGKPFDTAGLIKAVTRAMAAPAADRTPIA